MTPIASSYSSSSWSRRPRCGRASFAGKKVAVFGLGDGQGFTDTFCLAADTIANAAKEAGATLLGEIERIDEANEAEKTDERVAALEASVKAAM